MRSLLRIAMVAPVAFLSMAVATAAPSGLSSDDRLPYREDDTLGLDCVAEAVAFTEVADLAHVYRDEGNVFAGALFDLREQLLDCLATSSEDEDDRSIRRSGEDTRSI